MVGRLIRRERLPAPGGRQPAVALTIVVLTWWLVVGTVVVSMLSAPAASAPTMSFAVAPGRTARINQPGIPVWVIPVERAAYDEYQRGFQESNEELIEHAFTVFAWIEVSHHDAVRVVAVDGEAVQIELLDGRSGRRQGWLKTRHLDLPG
jgi:type IV secretory pathway protease TraF